MKAEPVIAFPLLGVEAEAIVDIEVLGEGEDTYTYSLDCITIVSIDGDCVEIEVKIDDLPAVSKTGLIANLDCWLDKYATEIMASESDYIADMAYDQFREAHDYE
jgi:hypothetical protein